MLVNLPLPWSSCRYPWEQPTSDGASILASLHQKTFQVIRNYVEEYELVETLQAALDQVFEGDALPANPYPLLVRFLRATELQVSYQLRTGERFGSSLTSTPSMTNMYTYTRGGGGGGKKKKRQKKGEEDWMADVPYTEQVEDARVLDELRNVLAFVREPPNSQGTHLLELAHVEEHYSFWGLPSIMKWIDVDAITLLRRQLDSVLKPHHGSVAAGSISIGQFSALIGPTIFTGKVCPWHKVVQISTEVVVRGAQFEKCLNVFARRVLEQIVALADSKTHVFRGVEILPGDGSALSTPTGDDSGERSRWSIDDIRSNKSSFVHAINVASVAKKRIMIYALMNVSSHPRDNHDDDDDDASTDSDNQALRPIAEEPRRRIDHAAAPAPAAPAAAASQLAIPLQPSTRRSTIQRLPSQTILRMRNLRQSVSMVSLSSALDTARTGATDASTGRQGLHEPDTPETHTFVQCEIQYCFHFVEKGGDKERRRSFEFLPLRSLYTGVFFSREDALLYFSLFPEVHNGPGATAVIQKLSEEAVKRALVSQQTADYADFTRHILMVRAVKAAQLPNNADDTTSMGMIADCKRVCASLAGVFELLAHEIVVFLEVLSIYARRPERHLLEPMEHAFVAMLARFRDALQSEEGSSEHAGLRQRVLFLLDWLEQGRAQSHAGDSLSSSAASSRNPSRNMPRSQHPEASRISHQLPFTPDAAMPILVELLAHCRAISCSIGSEMCQRLYPRGLGIGSRYRRFRKLPLTSPLALFSDEELERGNPFIRDDEQLVIPIRDSAVRNRLLGNVPLNIAEEAVYLQYTLDTELDRFVNSSFADRFFGALLPNPYTDMIVRSQSMLLLLDSYSDEDDRILRRLLTPLAPAGTGRLEGAFFSTVVDGKPSVYGSRAALCAVDPDAVYSLLRSVDSDALVVDAHVETGQAYRIDQSVALAAEATLLGSVLSEGAVGEFLVERAFYITGPLFSNALQLFATTLVDYVSWIHDSTQNIIHSMHVGRVRLHASKLKREKYRKQAIQAIALGAKRRDAIVFHGYFLVGASSFQANMRAQRDVSAPASAEPSQSASQPSSASSWSNENAALLSRQLSSRRTINAPKREGSQFRIRARGREQDVLSTISEHFDTEQGAASENDNPTRYVFVRVDCVMQHLSTHTKRVETCAWDRRGQAFDCAYLSSSGAQLWHSFHNVQSRVDDEPATNLRFLDYARALQSTAVAAWRERDLVRAYKAVLVHGLLHQGDEQRALVPNCVRFFNSLAGRYATLLMQISTLGDLLEAMALQMFRVKTRPEAVASQFERIWWSTYELLHSDLSVFHSGLQQPITERLEVLNARCQQNGSLNSDSDLDLVREIERYIRSIVITTSEAFHRNCENVDAQLEAWSREDTSRPQLSLSLGTQSHFGLGGDEYDV